MFDELKYSQHFWEKFWYIFGLRFYRKIVSQKANFFLKPNDIISGRPTLFGYHEPHVEKFISFAAQNDNDFFLDIGANIGLTSSLVGNNFKRVDCIEPNPLIFNILKTNIALNLNGTEYHLHPVGLGHADAELTLKVPYDNFGGAFLEQDNKLTQFFLEKKKIQLCPSRMFLIVMFRLNQQKNG